MDNPKINPISNQIESLRNEAYTLIQQAFKIPKGYADLSLNRLVDCIISAAVLEIKRQNEQDGKEYDVIDGSITHMLNPKNWDWIKSADVKDTIISHVRAIDTIRREYLESEKKAI